MKYEEGGVAPKGGAVPKRGTVDPLTLFKPHPRDIPTRRTPLRISSSVKSYRSRKRYSARRVVVGRRLLQRPLLAGRHDVAPSVRPQAVRRHGADIDRVGCCGKAPKRFRRV